MPQSNALFLTKLTVRTLQVGAVREPTCIASVLLITLME
jgi:hypothetical protein